MPLVIEDGSGLPNATSYVTLAELRSYAEARGQELPEEDTEVEVLLVKGADFLVVYEEELQGQRVNPQQALSFPRSGVTINCVSFPEDEVPSQVKLAQMQAAIEVARVSSGDLNPSVTTTPILREKIHNAVERQYMTPRQLSTTPDGTTFTPVYPKIDQWMFFLLRGNECPGSMRGPWLRVRRA